MFLFHFPGAILGKLSHTSHTLGSQSVVGSYFEVLFSTRLSWPRESWNYVCQAHQACPFQPSLEIYTASPQVPTLAELPVPSFGYISVSIGNHLSIPEGPEHSHLLAFLMVTQVQITKPVSSSPGPVHLFWNLPFPTCLHLCRCRDGC